MSMDSRRQISTFLDLIAGIGMKVGVPVAALGFVYLMYVIFGHKLDLMSSMKQADKAYLVSSIGIGRAMFTYGSVAAILALCIRYFYEETIGLILAMVGAAVYFFGPGAFSSLTLGSLKKNTTYHGIVNDFATIGLICLVPGCLLLVRDVVVRVANRLGARHEPPAVAEEITRKVQAHKPYEKCWDMSFCNDRSKRFCAAWEKRKSCWRVKSGCLCDQDIIRKALIERDRELGGGEPAETERAADTRPKIVLSSQQKSARCRACTIYMEHQRQKFRIASPAIMLAVLVVFVALYGRIAGVLYGLLERTDRFMSFLTYHEGAAASFASQGHIVTTLAMICLGVVLLSFTLRVLEYLIFDLQI